MAKINFNDKVNIVTKAVPEINKVTAANLNEIKTSVNTNVDNINNNASNLAAKADLNGNSTELFKVANALNSDEAISKATFDKAINSLQGALILQDNWNASTNEPNISNTLNTGYYWIVSADGSTDLGGITDWKINDWAIKTDSGWAKVDNTDKVVSVSGRIGEVVLNKADVQLNNVDNTTDANKPVSTAQATAIGLKVDKVSGERLINADEITLLGNTSNTNTGDNAINSSSATAAQGTLADNAAPKASPSFTGDAEFGGSVAIGAGSTISRLKLGGDDYKIEGGTNFGDIRQTAPRHRFFNGTDLAVQIDANKLKAFADFEVVGASTFGGQVSVGGTNLRGRLDLGIVSSVDDISTDLSDYQLILEAPAGTGKYTSNIAWSENTGVQVALASINAIDEGSSSATGLSISTGDSDETSERLRIKSNGDLDFKSGDATFGGSVGIGTTAANFDSKLQVVGRIRAGGGINGGYFFGDTEFDGGLYTPSDGVIAISTNNVERLRIKANGDFDFKSGDANFGGSVDVVDNDFTVRDFGGGNYVKLSRYEGLVLKGNGAGTKYISTPNTDGLGFKTNNIERFTIDKNGDSTFGGSVTVDSSIKVLGEFISSASESIIRLKNTGTNGRDFLIIAGGDSGTFNQGQFGIYDATFGDARLSIDAVGDVKVFKDFNVVGASTFGGNVGFGIDFTAILAKVQVKGVTDSHAAYIYNPSTTVGKSKGLLLEGGTNENDFSLKVQNAIGGSQLTIQGDDKVKAFGDFEVVGASIFGGDVGIDNSTFTTNRGNTSGEIARFRGLNSIKAEIGTTDSYFLTNVGIGRSNPTHQLDVNGTFRATDDATFGGSLEISNTSAAVFRQTNTHDGVAQSWIRYVGSNGDNIFRDETNSKTHLVFQNDGITRIDTDATFGGSVSIAGSVADSGSDPKIQLKNTDTTLGDDQIIGDIDFYQSDPNGDGAGVVSKIRSINSSNFKGQGDLIFLTGSATTLTERLRIDSNGNHDFKDGNATFGGSVLINQTSSVYSFELFQTGNAATSYNALRVRGNHTAAIGIIGTGGSSTGNTSFRDKFVMGTQTAHSTSLATSDTARYTIDSGGNHDFKDGNATFGGSVTADSFVGKFSDNYTALDANYTLLDSDYNLHSIKTNGELTVTVPLGLGINQSWNFSTALFNINLTHPSSVTITTIPNGNANNLKCEGLTSARLVATSTANEYLFIKG